MSQRNFAIDYDGTLDLAPEFWRRVFALAEEFNIAYWFVTCRRREDFDDDGFDALVEWTGLPRYRHLFTAGASKDWYCRQRGIVMDCWTDDDPACVMGGR